MGFSFSWLAVEGASADTVLEDCGLRPTGAIHADSDGACCFACLPNGWTVIFSQAFAFAEDRRLADLSRDGARAIGCQIDQDALYCRVACFRDGRVQWSLTHDSGQGPRHLAIEGIVPDGLYDIRNRLEAEQDANDVGDADSDFIFEIPVEVADLICGYRHDRGDCGGDPFVFSDAEPVGGYAEAALAEPWWRKNPFGES